MGIHGHYVVTAIAEQLQALCISAPMLLHGYLYLRGIYMSIHTFVIRFHDGAFVRRTEWGKTRKSALKTLESIYGKGNFVVVGG